MRVWLSLGSNIDPESNIRLAVRNLRRIFGPLMLSSVYSGEAVGFDGDPFLNMVVGLDTELPVSQLMERLRGVEDSQGRVRDEKDKNSPRTIDIDLLTYGDLPLMAGRVVLPRDEITRYAFVLKPLAEVAGDEVHPLTGRTYGELWAAFDKTRQTLNPVDLDLD
jgi:2-amino-4-hydroxy-6-hydroxymethyldihydropteridine diphosphokinase